MGHGQMTAAVVLVLITLCMIFATGLAFKWVAYEKKKAKEAEARAFALEVEIKKLDELKKKQEAIENDRQAKTGKVSTGHALTDFDASLDVLSNISAGH